jgi:methyltransferase (TIGR00027 family)
MSGTGSARFEGDTWDLASSVGATATMVAAARAMASTVDDALINDPFAEPLVRAVGVDFFTRLVTGELRPEDLDSDSESVGMQRMTDNMAVRTKFFDEFFLGATEGGIRQAVILASGLDSRAYRLAWPAGTTVYEIDQPDVIEFKTRTLANLGAEPTATRRTVAMDLRYDWPSALIEEGFDPNQPTAWSAEGLLGYLPPDAQDRLLDTITELSAPGSRVAVESVPNIDASDHEKAIERMRQASERWRDQGFDLDFAELVYLGDRNEASSYLCDHGWQLSRSSIKELFAANGLPPLPEDDEDAGNFGELQYVSGVLGGHRPFQARGVRRLWP